MKLGGETNMERLQFKKVLLILLMFVILFVLLTITNLFASGYIKRIVIGLGINIILVVSLNLSNGFTGVFSLGHIGFMAIGAYTSAVLTLPILLKTVNLPNLFPWLGHLEMSFLPAALIGGFVSMIIALLVGLPLLRLNGSYISVATMGFLVIVRVILINWDAVTRGARTFSGVPSYTTIWNVWIWVVLTTYVVLQLKNSSFGRQTMAMRDNEIAAQSLGINKLRVRLLAFCLSAFFTGIAGALWAHFIMSFSPNSFYFTKAFSVITMLIVGGLGSISGSVVGSVAITILSEVLRNLERSFNLGFIHIPPLYGASQVIMAVIFILILVFKPNGISNGKEINFLKITKGPFLSRKQKEVF
jgi:branched-chain amino acid transport system permease protein